MKIIFISLKILLTKLKKLIAYKQRNRFLLWIFHKMLRSNLAWHRGVPSGKGRTVNEVFRY